MPEPTVTSQNFPKLPIREIAEPVNQAAPAPAPPPPPPPPPSSSSSSSSPSEQLTEQQRIAIEIMLAGRPMQDAAAGAGVTRRTLYTWRHHHAAFRAELERRRADLWDEAADRIRALLDPAVRMLEEQIRSRYDQNRYSAARTILRLARVGAAVAVRRKEEQEDDGSKAGGGGDAAV